MNEENIYSISQKILIPLANSRETSAGKATLAHLRSSAGGSRDSLMKVWPLLFENLPENFLGYGKNLSHAEKSILTSLQMFAIHQQALSESVLINYEEKEFSNMGTSLKHLRSPEDSLAVDRRFNTMITAATYEELVHHLRQMIKLLRSRSKETVKVDYAKLSQDLYWFLRGNEDGLRLAWARQYYRTDKKGDEKNDQE